jgi:hypothetical protein
MTLEEFQRLCDRFTNKKLFVTDRRGEFVRDAGGNLSKVNYDNLDEGRLRTVEPPPAGLVA